MVESNLFRYNMTDFNFMPSFSVHKLSDTKEAIAALNATDIFLETVPGEVRFEEHSLPFNYTKLNSYITISLKTKKSFRDPSKVSEVYYVPFRQCEIEDFTNRTYWAAI